MFTGDDDVLIDDLQLDPFLHNSTTNNSNFAPNGDFNDENTVTNDWTLQPPMIVKQPEVLVCASPSAVVASYSAGISNAVPPGPIMAAEFLGGLVAGNVVVSGGWDQHLIVADALTGRMVRVNEGLFDSGNVIVRRF